MHSLLRGLGTATLPAFAISASVTSTASADAPPPGARAVLTTYAHRVAGVVTVIDHDTVRADPFWYDGTGIDVYFKLGAADTQAAFEAGIYVGPQLLGMPFDGGSIEIDLPPGQTLDNFWAVTVWCVAANANFGSGTFRCPSDFNEDGFVSGDDFDAFVAVFVEGGMDADFNMDGFVTGDDFDQFITAFNNGC